MTVANRKPRPLMLLALLALNLLLLGVTQRRAEAQKEYKGNCMTCIDPSGDFWCCVIGCTGSTCCTTSPCA